MKIFLCVKTFFTGITGKKATKSATIFAVCHQLSEPNSLVSVHGDGNAYETIASIR